MITWFKSLQTEEVFVLVLFVFLFFAFVIGVLRFLESRDL